MRGAISNALTKEEVRVAMMQVANDCGVPAGIDSFRAAHEMFAGTGT